MKPMQHSKWTHIIVKSKQKCHTAAWWPSEDPDVGAREKVWPMMALESGQITRINANNLKLLK